VLDTMIYITIKFDCDLLQGVLDTMIYITIKFDCDLLQVVCLLQSNFIVI
jgi:hypothetical protein